MMEDIPLNQNTSKGDSMTEKSLSTTSLTTPTPTQRLRRLRVSPSMRRLVRETTLTPNDFIFPLFIEEGLRGSKAIGAMPGQFRFGLDMLAAEAKTIANLGIPSVILFGIPTHKDPEGHENYNPNGIIPQAIQRIKEAAPELVVMVDLCFCEYTDHGHCGIINTPDHSHYNAHLPEGYLLNDATLELLQRAAVVHAEAGADVIAPSGMVDGMVGAIRSGLDQTGFSHTSILSYAIKTSSGFYNPFREAVDSAPSFGDRQQYQMDGGNSREALREAALDVQEGADMLMIKPALTNLDLIQTTRNTFGLPTAAYQVSGEYAMLHAAAAQGWLDLPRTALETLTSIKRAGADMIVTYFAQSAVKWLE
jgi:porphobilinogen synthase